MFVCSEVIKSAHFSNSLVYTEMNNIDERIPFLILSLEKGAL